MKLRVMELLYYTHLWGKVISEYFDQLDRRKVDIIILSYPHTKTMPSKVAAEKWYIKLKRS